MSQYYVSVLDTIKEKQKLLDAFIEIAGIVGSTMGPGGRTVSMNEPGRAFSTKDGANILSVMSFKDPMLHFASNIYRDITQRTVSKVGDGTTLTTILTAKLLEMILKSSTETLIYEKLTALDGLVEDVIVKIKEIAYKIDTDKAEGNRLLESVATISANNDVGYGKLVSEIVGKLGINGHVSVKPSHKGYSYTEQKKGYVVGGGPIHSSFMRGQKKIVLEDAYTLILDVEMDDLDKDIMSVVQGWILRNKQDGNDKVKPLVLFVRSVKGAAIQFLINNLKHPIYPIQIPTFLFQREDRYDIIRDMQAAVGCSRIYSPVEGYDIKQWDTDSESHLSFGVVKRVEILPTECSVEYDGLESIEENVSTRIKEIENRLLDNEDDGLLKTRLSIIKSGIGVLYVDIKSENERGYIYDLLDDSIKASFSALKHGVVPGGGQALLRVLYGNKDVYWHSLLHNVMMFPFVTIMVNAGLEEKITSIVKDLASGGFGRVYDIKRGGFCDLVDSVVWDPADAIIQALTNAMSAVKISTSKFMINFEMKEDGRNNEA